MLSRKERSVARKLLSDLALSFPSAHPIKLRFKELEDHGDCELLTKDPKIFLIRISPSTDFRAMVPILIHELAHAVSWYWEEDDHGPIFGYAYARLWSLWADEE